MTHPASRWQVLLVAVVHRDFALDMAQPRHESRHRAVESPNVWFVFATNAAVEKALDAIKIAPARQRVVRRWGIAKVSTPSPTRIPPSA
jgi:hypothetical protein